jgi:uncharacterized protein with FMN-binding domain
MRRLTLWILSTTVIVVLLFSYHTSTSGAGTPTAATRTPKPKGVIYQGTLVPTRFGPNQVIIELDNGRISDAFTTTQPSGDARTDQINAAAIPKLDQRALAAQTADFDVVSGATYTSNGYRESLQAAIDKSKP